MAPSSRRAPDRLGTSTKIAKSPREYVTLCSEASHSKVLRGARLAILTPRVPGLASLGSGSSEASHPEALVAPMQTYSRRDSHTGLPAWTFPCRDSQTETSMHWFSQAVPRDDSHAEIPMQRFSQIVKSRCGDGSTSKSDLSHGTRVKARKKDTHVGSTGRVLHVQRIMFAVVVG